MHRSREIIAAVVIILAPLACFFLLKMKPERPAPQAGGQAGFVTTSTTRPKAPRAFNHEQGPAMRNTAEASQLPPGSKAALRRGADERFPARLDLLVLDSTTHLPIRGVRVTAMNRATQETVAEQVLPEGRGTMDLPTGTLFLTFAHPDYQESRLWIEFTSAVGEINRQTIQLRREVQVSGTVRDQNGAPVSRATVFFAGHRQRRAGQIITGPDGRFECRLQPGPVSGTAFKAANRASFTSEVAATGATILDITLPITSATISFAGRVLNQKGEPVEGAVIRIRTDSQLPEFGYSQTTEEDGTFVFTLSPSVAGLVSISAVGARGRVERVPLLADLERDFVIDSQPAFTVTLLTPEGKALTKGFRVEGVGASVAKILKLPDGRYYSTAYPVDIRAIAVESGYGNSEVARLSAYEPEVTLRIEPGGNLRGRAVDPSGRPVSRFSYLLLQGKTLCLSQSMIDSPDGGFIVRHVTPGRYTLRVVADGHPVEEREILIESGRDCFVEMIL